MITVRPLFASALCLALSLGASFTPILPVAPALAATAPLSPADQALVDQATAYLQGLKTVTGHFTQVSANGATSTGTFYMQRPGKARFQYDPPAQMVVVSDGYNVSVVDMRLKTHDQYPLGRTPLVILLARQVRLDRGVVVTQVDQTADGFAITARDGRKEASGRITLDFGKDPVALRGWSVIDAQGRETRVSLGALAPVSDLDPNLFVIQDDRVRSGRP
jgi:outer membrane lipoprotein-sorting protein